MIKKKNTRTAKVYLNSILVAVVLLFWGCEDYLEKDNKASEFLTQEEVFADRVKINGIVGRLYDTLEWMFEIRAAGPNGQRRNSEETGKNYGNINLLSGEGISTWSRGPVDAMTLGNFRPLVLTRAQNPELDLVWRNSWELVSVTNDILDIVDEISTEVLTEEERLQLKGEAFLFRAFAYHELSKRWGPMPYFKERLDINTDFDLPRPTFAELTADIVADCDAAFTTLPRATWLNDPTNMGRIGKAAALGIKSRHLTIAASPNYALFDPNNSSVDHFGNDSDLWLQAAEAAAQLITYAQGESQVGLYEGDYNLIFHTSAGTIEGIWPRYYPQVPPITYRLSWFSKSQGGNYGIAPSQELVDRFETTNGLLPADDPSFNPQDPYIERDPRFYKNIFYHGAPMFTNAIGQTADMRSTPLGVNRRDATLDSKTGYLVKKMIPENWNLNNAGSDVRFLNMPYMRMAEIYLNYAEAVNEVIGPNGTAGGLTLTGVEALNVLRRRVGHVDVNARYTDSQDSFRELVRNEFRVELCFEYHTWFDLIRWRIAEEELNGISFTQVLIEADADLTTYPTGFKFGRGPIDLPRVFEKRNYRYPIPQADLEIFDSSNLLQNPGW